MSVGSETIRALLNAGYAPTTICLTLNIPMDEIRPLLTDQERQTQIRDDAMLRDAMRVLASRVTEEALRVMDEGTPADKMKLITQFGGQMVKVLNQEEQDSLADMRDNVNAMMRELRQDALGGEVLVGPLTDGEPTEDQNQEPHG